MADVAPTIRRWINPARTVVALLLVVAAGWVGLEPLMHPQVAALSPFTAIPGASAWKDGASSFVFGTNDTYEWSDANIQTQPAIQLALRNAGFTLIRTLIPDKADDEAIERRIKTIENSGAKCLAVLTNVHNTSFNEHVVSYLGKRCLLYEFGNEPDYNGVSVDDYVSAWNKTMPSLRRINPDARFIGPAVSNDQGANGFLAKYLNGVKTSGILPDAISFHYYPCFNDSKASCLARASSYKDAVIGVRQQVKRILGRELPVGVTEWNYDPGNPPPAYGDESDFMTQFSKEAIKSLIAGGAAFACQFDAASYSGFGRLDMFDVDTGQAKPQYYALREMIRQYRPISSGGQSGPGAAPSALISKGAKAVCTTNDTGPNEPMSLLDGKFANWGFWQLASSGLPGSCALHLNNPAGKVIVAWFSDYSFDYTDSNNLAPRDYDIAVSADSTDGSNGNWKTMISVRGNQARAREHLLDFSGKSWLRMTVLAGQPQASQPYIRIDELEVFDAQKLAADSFFFSGDSITAMSYDRAADNSPSFADKLASCAPFRYPLMIDGGFGGQTSEGAIQQIASWQTLLPDMHYWLLGWGTNDALNGLPPAAFQANLQTLVTAILARGGVPIFAHIPYSTAKGRPGLDAEIQSLNQVIDAVTAANTLIVGPDFYGLFKAHPEYLLPDGIHPTGPGAIAMNDLWFKALKSPLGLSASSCE
jgi:lysophospholipase L1-like esterase